MGSSIQPAFAGVALHAQCRSRLHVGCHLVWRWSSAFRSERALCVERRNGLKKVRLGRQGKRAGMGAQPGELSCN